MERNVNMEKQRGKWVKGLLPFYLFTFIVQLFWQQTDIIGRW